MDESRKQKLGSYLSLLRLHRGEARDAYDKAARVYDEFAAVRDRGIAAPALEHFNQMLAARVHEGAGVLDAGAGTGERTLNLLRSARPGHIVALDASTGMLKVAREKIRDPRVHWLQGDLAELPFPDESFDVVLCAWTVKNPAGAPEGG